MELNIPIFRAKKMDSDEIMERKEKFGPAETDYEKFYNLRKE